MTTDRWQTLDRIFVEALQLPAEARARMVAQACGDDGGLRDDILSLLAAADTSGAFLEKPALERLAGALAGDGWSLRPGERLGAYTIREQLGAGAVGEVWRATDERLVRDVAIKVLLPHLSNNPERARHFVEEARTAGSLNHPNIVSVHDVGEHGGAPFIVSEYVDGESLRARLSRGPLSIEAATEVSVQIARGLAAAHARGIIHRDLKPDNVFLRSDGGVKILDFGLATLKSTSSAHSDMPTLTISSMAGTAGYAAPEQISGQGTDPRCDLFALGVTMYEMLAGKRPFQGQSAIDTLHATLTVEPTDIREIRKDVPPALALTISRLLEKTPEARFQSVAQLLSDLDRQTSTAAVRARSRASLSVFTVAAVMTAIAIAGALRWRTAAADVSVPPGATDRSAIAVMNFVDMTRTDDAAWLATGIPSMLVTGLAETPGLDVVSAQRVEEALKHAGHTNLSALDKTQVAEVARRAGARTIVAGSIFRSGDEIRVDAQVEDLDNGRVVAAHTVRSNDVFALADSLATRIRTGIGLATGVELRRITDVSSTSIEAYRLYTKALDASVNLRWPETMTLLEQAVAIDPTFAEAHIRLAPAYAALGRTAARDQALRNAAAHANRLSERHRLLLSVQLELRVHRNLQRSAQLLDELLNRFPDVEEAYPIASGLYDPVTGALPNAEKLLAITRAGVTAMPFSPQTRNAFGYALLAAGRMAEAVREFEEYARLAPREPNPFDSLGDAYLVLGAPAKAAESYSRALAIDPGFPSGTGLAYAFGMLGRYQEAIDVNIPFAHVRAMVLSRVGRYADAERIARRSIARAYESKDRVAAAGLHLVVAVLALEQKAFARVLRDSGAARAALATAPGTQKEQMTTIADALDGLAQLGLGQIGQAAALAGAETRAAHASSPASRWWHAVLKGEIALAQGNAGAAAAAFGSARQPQRRLTWAVPASILTNNLVLRDGLARAAAARGDRAEAIKIYRQLLANGPDLEWVSLHEPRYVLKLARLLDVSGDRRAARAEYSRFLELWKDADRHLPELVEARRAVME